MTQAAHRLQFHEGHIPGQLCGRIFFISPFVLWLLVLEKRFELRSLSISLTVIFVIAVWDYNVEMGLFEICGL